MTSNFTAAELRAQARTIEHSGLPEFFRGCVYRALREYAALKEAAEFSAQDASPKDGWQPIETIPAGVVVVLLNINRHRSDDLLNCCKDIGYLTEGGWFSTFCETRGMTKDAFTHWTHLLPDPEPPK